MIHLGFGVTVGSLAPAREQVAAALLVGVVFFTASGAAAQTRMVPPADAKPTRLFIGPTARPLAQGDGYLVLHGGFIPSFQVGVTNRVSVGAGTFFFAGGSVWLTPKVHVFSRGAMSVSGTLAHLVVPGEGSLGFAFGSVTRDTLNGGVTAGLGAAYSEDWDDDHDWASSGPLIMFGADKRIGHRVTLITENYIVASGDGAALVMGGFRTQWGRFALDKGLLVIAAGNDVLPGLVLNAAWSF